MKYLLLFMMLCSFSAKAADVFIGTLETTSGVSKNNTNTTSPFVLTIGLTLVQCNVDVYLSVGAGPDAVATANTGVKLVADQAWPFTATMTFKIIAVIPVGPENATCKVFSSKGEVASRRIPSVGGSGTYELDPDREDTAKNYWATDASGPGISFSSVREDLIKMPGSNGTIGVTAGGIMQFCPSTSGDCTIRVGNGTMIGSSLFLLNDRLDLYNAGFIDSTIGGVVKLAKPLRVSPQNLAIITCDVTHEWWSVPDGNSGASTGVPGRVCTCLSDGAGVYTWKDEGGALC